MTHTETDIVTASQQAGTPLHPNAWATFMFVSLSQQAEGWAYMLKGKVNQRTKQLLNYYLNAARSLMSELAGSYDINDLIDDSAVWSDLMQMMRDLPQHKREALYLAMREFIQGNITIEDSTQPGVQVTATPSPVATVEP